MYIISSWQKLITILALSLVTAVFAQDDVFQLLDTEETIETTSSLPPPKHLVAKKAEIAILNKLTAKTQKISLSQNKIAVFDNLNIILNKCIKVSDPYASYDTVLITMVEHKVDQDSKLIFEGWLIAGQPALSSLGHPIYEVFALNCQ